MPQVCSQKRLQQLIGLKSELWGDSYPQTFHFWDVNDGGAERVTIVEFF